MARGNRSSARNNKIKNAAETQNKLLDPNFEKLWEFWQANKEDFTKTLNDLQNKELERIQTLIDKTKEEKLKALRNEQLAQLNLENKGLIDSIELKKQELLSITKDFEEIQRTQVTLTKSIEDLKIEAESILNNAHKEAIIIKDKAKTEGLLEIEKEKEQLEEAKQKQEQKESAFNAELQKKKLEYSFKECQLNQQKLCQEEKEEELKIKEQCYGKANPGKLEELSQLVELMEFHTKWDGASYDVGHALSHQVGQLFTASALFTIN